MSWLHVDNSPCGSSTGRSGNELHYCVAILLLNTHTHILPVQTLSTKHHRLLPIRELVISHSSSNTHNAQVLNCLLTATAARLDQDTASPQLDKAFMRVCTCAGLVVVGIMKICADLVLLKLWFKKCQQQQQLRSSRDYVLVCQLAMIGSSCHIKLLTASTINMATIYLWFSYK